MTTKRPPRPARRGTTTRSGARAGFAVVALAACGATALAVPGPASAAPAPTTTTTTAVPGDSAAAIAQASAEAAQMETVILSQQQQLETLSERYDRANVELAQIRRRLTSADASLAAARRRQAAARRQLRTAAVDAYMSDSAGAAIDELFSPTSDATTARIEYQDTAIGDVSGAINAEQASERRLDALRASLHRQEQRAGREAAVVQQAQRQAQATAAASQSTLAQVKGHLAQLIAQQAAVQAAQAAAVAEAAASAAARQAAARQAEAAAQVAETVDAGSSAASSAGSSANQAAGGSGSVGSGSPPPAGGPGAVAVAAAESYLGVPYVWGGASRAGVDCSGLVMLAWQAAGVSLVHSAALQYDESVHIPLDQVQPGDLLFYDFDGTGIDHVVMYVGSGPYGADTIIQAAHTGTVVEFDPIWYGGLVGAGRP